MRECRQPDTTDVPEAQEPHSPDEPSFVSSNSPPTAYDVLDIQPGHNSTHPTSDVHTDSDIADSHPPESQLCSRRGAGAPPPVSLPCSGVRVADLRERRIKGQQNRQLRFTEDASLPISPKTPRRRREPTPWSSPQEEEEDEDILYLPPHDTEQSENEYLNWYAPSNQLFTC